MLNEISLYSRILQVTAGLRDISQELKALLKFDLISARNRTSSTSVNLMVVVNKHERLTKAEHCVFLLTGGNFSRGSSGFY